ncbi:uncharacterized protein LOC124116616 isoform X2 [Haliotis rufescens]|uniref:uncharacterized protein LOC124116616 isoform X2 n=1 Tax=Haliotis rufescens TaxID=6454 RepID=UPI00201E86B1|nr:uncharacterized protein LOC124116616 isoform X2 [Haliotis rufescens]
MATAVDPHIYRLLLLYFLHISLSQQASASRECHCTSGCDVNFWCTGGCLQGWSGPTCQIRNIALNKSTEQSSTINDCKWAKTAAWKHVCGDKTSSLAVDGVTSSSYWSGTCTHTATGKTFAWWTVDLGETHLITNLTIFFSNRQRMTGFLVRVDDHPCYQQDQSHLPISPVSISCDTPTSGQSVTVRLPTLNGSEYILNLCEVEIYECADGVFGPGCSSWCLCKNTSEVCDKDTGHCESGCADGHTGADCQEPSSRECHCTSGCDVNFRCTDGCLQGWSGPTCQIRNIALNKSTEQSSTVNDCQWASTAAQKDVCGNKTSSLAVDGVTNSSYWSGTCTHTATGRPPAEWTVDLGETHLITNLTIFFSNRQRMRGFFVRVDDHPCYQQDKSHLPRSPVSISCDTPTRGQRVTVRLPTLNGSKYILNLCEVEIYECADGSFGPGCSSWCLCKNTSEVCDKDTGHCESGCADGHTGADCQEPTSSRECHCTSGCDVNFRCTDGCLQGWSGPTCQIRNIALNKSTQQSSTINDCQWASTAAQKDVCGDKASSLAVDGVTSSSYWSGTCTHTATGWTSAWWTVDLGETHLITNLTIFFSTPKRMRGFLVRVDDHPCYQQDQSSLPSSPVSISCDTPTSGQSVTVRLPTLNGSEYILNLCEVEIYECADGSFGPGCSSWCLCKYTSEVCDKATGHCESGCADGHTGADCQEQCKDRFYGAQCSSRCGRCRSNAICSKTSGDCPDGCEPGWQGKTCDQECDEDRYGDGCSETCGQCAGKCSPVNGTCDQEGCSDGWMGQRCDEECKDRFYGAQCSSRCGRCRSNAICSKTSGDCPDGCEPGWKGKTCDQECDEDRYGDGCSETCGQCAGKCSPVDGTCDQEGCSDGWMGQRCDEECKDRFYGAQCSSRCGRCRSNAICSKTSGDCPDGCEPGWQGKTCDQACPDGTFGLNCGQRCGQCLAGHVCDKVTGQCPGSRCERGWMGLQCGTACNGTGFYGYNCNETCGMCLGDDCHHITGECPRGCRPKYEGATCNLKEPTNVGTQAGMAVFVAVLVVLVIIAVYLLKRRQQKRSNGEVAAASSDVVINPAFPGEEGVLDENDDDGIYANVEVTTVKVAKLREYIAKREDKFVSEYGRVPRGLLHPHTAAISQEHMAKNRFKAMYPYDHSRVVLQKIPGDKNSDYINANYINTYKRKKAFIATQGPTPKTVGDFWRMVWQEETNIVVMLTRLKEGIKVKCEKYWPERNNPLQLADLTITNDGVVERPDYCIRQMILQHKKLNERRRVMQLHYVTWPDHDVPSSPQLVRFWKVFRSMTVDSQAPVVVHCSAGVGRTGTFIGLDALMERALQEGVVDVHDFVLKMRADRVSMVQTKEQYLFIHQVVLEALHSDMTQMTPAMFNRRFSTENLASASEEAILKREWEKLHELNEELSAPATEGALLSENTRKNRSQNILPADKCRPILSLPVAESNDYINAVFVPTETRQKSLLATQLPLPWTVVDFWRMVLDHDVQTIVSLVSEECSSQVDAALFWPKTDEVLECGPFLVTKTDSKDEAIVLKVWLKNADESTKKDVTLLFVTDWAEGVDTPTNTSQFLGFINDLDARNTSDNIAVMCMDGASKCGLVCAVLNIIQRLKQDQEIDVFLTVRLLQTVRPSFLISYAQYQFCYKLVKEYQKTSNTVYENFQG